VSVASTIEEVIFYLNEVSDEYNSIIQMFVSDKYMRAVRIIGRIAKSKLYGKRAVQYLTVRYFGRRFN